MRKRIWLIGFLLLTLLAACSPAAKEATPLPSTTDDGGLSPSATTIPADTETDSGSALPEGYPAPPTPVDTPEGYPAAPELPPTPDPYPAGEMTWILQAVGEQCADESENSYADLQEAVASLAAAGIPSTASEMAELMVCAACGCPTSAHFRVQIGAADVSKAISLGWTAEE